MAVAFAHLGRAVVLASDLAGTGSATASGMNQYFGDFTSVERAKLGERGEA